jgi:hypothetical protein
MDTPTPLGSAAGSITRPLLSNRPTARSALMLAS